MNIRGLVKRLLGTMGRLEYLTRPGLRTSWGGPFNGQRYRLRVFADLLHELDIKAIVETGTFRGTTTALFAATALQVHTTEVQPRYFSYSRMRFALNRSNLHLSLGDSRSFLRRLAQDPSVPKESVFFYLDAHWQNDLPLREELDLIFSNWTRPIAMVDDFQVPGSTYGYDDYQSGKGLTLDYIAPIVAANHLAVFFPAADPAQETGSRRGSVVLCQDEVASVIDARVKTLVRSPTHA